MKKLKTSKESKDLNETIGEKLSQFRNKINEIVDYINSDIYNKNVNDAINDIISKNKKLK